jgi:hypothetical protein
MEYTGVLYLQSNTMYGMTHQGKAIYKFRSFDGKEGLVATSIQKTTRRNQFITTEKSKIKDRKGDIRINMTLKIHHGSVDSNEAYLNALIKYHNLSVKIPYWKKMPYTPIEFPIQTESNNHIYTIDPSSARDYDDAVSFYPEQNKIGIHITYIGYQLSKYLSSLKNYSTIYGNTKIINMLPIRYSIDNFSLVQSKSRNVISLYIQKNMNITPPTTSLEWKLEKITVKQNLSYEEANTIIPTEIIENAMSILSLHDTGNENEYYDAYGPSTTHLIMKAALIYNITSANKLMQNQIQNRAVPPNPFILRKQIEAFAEYDYANDIYMNKQSHNKQSHNKQSHRELDVDLYCHITSPIRRITDIYNQCLLFDILKNKYPELSNPHQNERLLPLTIDTINQKMIASKSIMSLDWMYSLFNNREIPPILKGTVKQIYDNTLCINVEILDKNKYIYIPFVPYYLDVLWNVGKTEDDNLIYKHVEGTEITISPNTTLLMRVIRTRNPYPRVLIIPTFLWEDDVSMAQNSVKQPNMNIFNEVEWIENYC